MCYSHQLEYNQEYERHLPNTYHNDGVYGHPVNSHISDTNFLSPRMIGKQWSRHQGVKRFGQDQTKLCGGKRLERKKIIHFNTKTLRKANQSFLSNKHHTHKRSTWSVTILIQYQKISCFNKCRESIFSGNLYKVIFLLT